MKISKFWSMNLCKRAGRTNTFFLFKSKHFSFSCNIFLSLLDKPNYFKYMQNWHIGNLFFFFFIEWCFCIKETHAAIGIEYRYRDFVGDDIWAEKQQRICCPLNFHSFTAQRNMDLLCVCHSQRFSRGAPASAKKLGMGPEPTHRKGHKGKHPNPHHIFIN